MRYIDLDRLDDVPEHVRRKLERKAAAMQRQLDRNCSRVAKSAQREAVTAADHETRR